MTHHPPPILRALNRNVERVFDSSRQEWKIMDTALSFLIPVGITAFGIWCVAGGGIGPHLTWSLIGFLPILVGLFSLYETARNTKHS
jgi:hypothetical protein